MIRREDFSISHASTEDGTDVRVQLVITATGKAPVHRKSPGAFKLIRIIEDQLIEAIMYRIYGEGFEDQLQAIIMFDV